ncbi:adhesion G protein-coupled receptor F5 [Eublepharis macularius]|uniref:Adhesion G protein-coupled receptor F5 n=1 Tax=Eublepharis macularius TaxID=481883 RepID=A0AA97K9V9_EUBMA|nr:adhesion G protein-coupled receptor F5 [Eublepharis macularius]XP_054852592.1 adhesion G protein-coupled receptor F5 [Eublepharis macularius]
MLSWRITLFCALLQIIQGSTQGLWESNSGSIIHSPLHGNRGREEVTVQRGLHRQKRQAGLPVNHTIVVEIHFADSSLENTIKSYLSNLSLPILINASDSTEKISSIQLTTVCNSAGNRSTNCCCEDGYGWSNEVCRNPAYPSTTTASEEHRNCISQLPSQEIYCLRQDPGGPEEIFIRKMYVRLNVKFQNDLRNPSSKLYKQYKRDLENAFTKGYGTLRCFISSQVTGFRNGSTVVDYKVTSAGDIPVAKANAKIAEALNTSYHLDPTSFGNYSVEIYGGTNISISPKPFFTGDTVTIRCDSRVASSNVTWHFGGHAISNGSQHSVTSAFSDTNASSTLKIRNISPTDSGLYSCAFTERDRSPTTIHLGEVNITVSSIQIVKSGDIVMECNGEQRELSCCVDTEMSFFNVQWKPNGAINISGTNYSTSNCTYYLLQANETQCPASKSGTITTYTCELSTADGARQSKHISVKYLRKANIALDSNVNGQVSEGYSFFLTCRSDVSNYDKVSWQIQNGNLTDIDSLWYTTKSTENEAVSVLAVQKANQDWNGTYTCTFFQEFLASSARLAMKVFSLPLEQDITRDPIQAVVSCPGEQALKCCVAASKAENYAVTFKSDKNPSDIPYEMKNEGNFICYNGTLRFNDCKDIKPFNVFCEFTNQINGRVRSSPMNLRLAPKDTITCNSSEVGLGGIGAEAIKPCPQQNITVQGEVTYKCDHTQHWVIARNSCLSVPVNDLVLKAESLVSSPAPIQELPAYLKNLSDTVKNEKKDIRNSSADLGAVIKILNTISVIPVEAEKKNVENFLSTVDTIISNPTDTWSAVKNGSSQLLDSVEQFSNSLLAINNTIPSVTLENVQLQGVVVNSTNYSDYNKDFIFSSLSNLSGNVLIDERQIKTGNLSQSTIISVAYSNLSLIIPQDEQKKELINGLVISTVAKPSPNNSFQIKMTFAKSNKSLIDPRCVFWNFSFSGDQGGWDNTGCESENNGENVSCTCNHLTSFSVLMSPDGHNNHDALSYITYIGLGISILSLVACIVIEALVWKSVTKTRISYMRHVCILNVAISLLIADVWFIVVAAKKKMDANICIAATFFVHFFYLCVFFWMLSLSLMLFYHLVFILHNTSKTVMKAVAFCLGYGCPLIISALTIAVTLPQHTYTRDDLCILNWNESKALLALVVPALVIVAINAVITVVVIGKIPIRSIGERSRNDERSSLYRITKSIGVLTPLLGLTWGFGLATVFEGSSLVFHILFNFFNAFQGLFILLFGILWDRKVREALLSKCSLSRWSSQTSKSSTQGTSAPMLSISYPFSRALNNLFGKAGKYQVSTESASSSSENTSKAYSLLT